MNDPYLTDFQKLLSHTSEKSILLDEITKDIQRYHVSSLLDIGAGDGLLAIPLASKVKRYCAIEKRDEYVKVLRAAGLDVIAGKFPTELNEVFDCVLSSHALDYHKEIFEPYIATAWRYVKPGGVLLIITYRGEKDDWTELLRYLGVKMENFHRVGYDAIIKLLYSLGEVKMRKVITTVNASALDDVIDALSFVFSNGHAEEKAKFLSYRNKLEKILNSKYRSVDGCRFPFQHFFIATLKNR